MRKDGEKFQLGERTEKKTAREGTPIPWKEAARVRTQGPLKKTARERIREPSENQLKGGEFRESERKRSGRKIKKKKEKKKVKYRRSWWKKRKERNVSLFTARKGKKRKAERETDVPERDKSW